MNEKDGKAYLNWINQRAYRFDMDGDCWLNKEVVSIFSETQDAWEDACKYKQREIDELLAENAKLREVVRFYANHNSWQLGECVIETCDQENWQGGKRARQVLKELEEK